MPSQTSRLYEYLKDGKPHRTDHILEAVYGNNHLGLARVAGRVWDLKKKLPHGLAVKSWPDPENRALWFYQIITTETEGQLSLFAAEKKEFMH